jgi:23S rRNA (pseudouridine1915-N3)-methyltransferase
MKLRLIALGANQPGWVDDGVSEYGKRFAADWLFELIEIKPEKRAANRSVETVLAAEAERIRAQIPRQALTIALDERGEQLTTRELAAKLTLWARDAPSAAFVIGSADGLDATFKTDAHFRLGMSRLTLPHGLVRIFLTEQLYRAVSLLSAHPYHRD